MNAETFQTAVLLFGFCLILFAVFRLMYINTANPHNVSLTNWMLTGGLPALLVGLTKGLLNLLKRHMDDNARLAAILLIGVLIVFIAIKLLGGS